MTHTPESFRTAADFLASMHLHAAADTLRIEADKLERQADEKRIDELARIFYEAEIVEIGDPDGYPEYHDQKTNYRNGTIAGVRALLAKLDKENAAATGTAKEWTVPTRRWGDLDDIPADVRTVYNASGNLLCRQGDGWLDTEWNLHPTSGNGAPFTESNRNLK
ncbi:hypothetical protein M1M07_23810 [Rhodococcus sp. HM1]|uniref:hypothetical protein n=1 Tax=Rhodococcus sp. HM1 TaxID=2937759 RepID=UPI00200AFFF0|nr:hypothetical protein [Rhodococcus sp. HM1]MCK8674124.1 hypothetical protein [Rhodococcus sp. HM1]